MGRQSSRLIYQGKDHKDIFFRGKYHNAMYLGNKLLWKKLQKIIPYISYDHYYREMCINTIDIDTRTIKKAVSLTGISFNDDKIVRGVNTVGYFLKDTSWVFSQNGQRYFQTPPMGETSLQGQLSAQVGYALTKSCFLGVTEYVSSYGGSGYKILSRDIESFERNQNLLLDKTYGRLYSGIIHPKFDLFIYRILAEGSLGFRFGVAKASLDSGGHYFSYSTVDTSRNILGANDRYVYAFYYSWNSLSEYRNRVERYNFISGTADTLYSTIDRDFYMNIIGSFYENGKFIVYCAENRSIGDDGRLQIYETTNFLSFTKIETPRSIKVKDISSEGTHIISFDSAVSGDVYIQPYCNLDNTFYFDESGIMHDDEGCLFHANINEVGLKKIVTIYFDNHYFRESDNNFCQILIFEEDIEPPLG